MALKVLVVDDEPLAQDILRKYTEDLKNVEVKGFCSDAVEALNFLNSESIDLVFLDINMPKISGIDFLKSLRTAPMVILTTAYSEYALEGYELNVLDYLVKPFSLARFLKSINKAEQFMNDRMAVLNKAKPESIFIKSNKKSVQISLNEIIYVEGLGDYIIIYTDHTHYVTNLSMKKMQDILNEDQFIRIHKSHLVNLKKIKTIEGNMVEIAGKKLIIGNNYRAGFFEKIAKMSI